MKQFEIIWINNSWYSKRFFLLLNSKSNFLHLLIHWGAQLALLVCLWEPSSWRGRVHEIITNEGNQFCFTTQSLRIIFIPSFFCRPATHTQTHPPTICSSSSMRRAPAVAVHSFWYFLPTSSFAGQQLPHFYSSFRTSSIVSQDTLKTETRRL